MSNRAFARAFCASTALCGVLAAIPAVAQLAPPAPVRESIDANGVDLFLGTFNIDAPALTIGDGGAQGLAYYKFSRGQGWTDNLVATLNLNGSTMTVSVDGKSDRFTVSGGIYTATEGNGSTLVFNSTNSVYTYTRNDGTVVTFNRNRRTTEAAYHANEGRVDTITYPSGAVLTFNYEGVVYCSNVKAGGLGYICQQTSTIYRLSTVDNNHGYRVTFGYLEDYLYDPSQPEVQPDFYNWANPTAATASNLAAPAGAPAPSQNFATVTAGGVTTLNVTDALGRTTKYRINGWNVLGVTRPGSTAEDVTITNNMGIITSVATAAGTTSYVRSDGAGVRTVIVTDPLSHVTTYSFDIASQRMTGVTDALGDTTTYQHDGAGRVTRITRPEGNYTQIAYDARGNVTERRVVAKAPGTPADIVTSASYPAICTNVKTCNQPASTTDARGNVTDYAYDAVHGGVLSVTAPAPAAGAVRPQTRYGYASLQAYYRNAAGSIVASAAPVVRMTSVSACQTLASCAGTADEVRTTIDYGPQTAGVGNNLLPVSVSQGAGDGSLTATSAYAYDPIGNRVAVDGPLAGSDDTVHTRYDAARQPVGTIAPDPDGAGVRKRAATRLTYDPRGRVTLAERGSVAGTSDGNWAAFIPSEAVAASYDTADRKLTESLTSGGTAQAVTQYSYDGHRLDCVAVRMNPAAWGTLPASACTAQTAGAAGPDRISRTGYDNADRVTLVQTAYGVSGEQADEVATTYSDNGKPLTLTDAEGNRTTYEYDGHDRLAKTRYPSPTTDGVSSATDYTQPSYDANGNVTALRLRDGNMLGYAYDALDRPTLLTTPHLTVDDQDTTFTYDLLGRLTRAAKNALNQTVLSYDALGRLAGESNYYYGLASQYDAAGRRTRLTWNDGFYVTYDYDVAGNMTAIRENGAASGIGVLASYAYDDLGRRASLTRGNGTVTSYGYDAVSRLSSLGHDLAGTADDLTLGFGYNPAGQIASATRSNDAYAWGGHYNRDVAEAANGLNQLTAQGATGIGYDARGNLTSIGGQAYGYTSRNRLASVAGVTELFADSLERLDFISSAGLLLAHDGSNLVSEIAYNGTAGPIQRRYVHGPGVDEPIVWYEGSGTTDRRWLHADERGSIVAVSNASGAATSINAYDEYGVPASGNSGRFQYTGQAWLPEIGMYHYKARTYDPKLGRFLQADPIGYGDGMNMYAYVGGDPVNGIDPTGMKVPTSCTGSIIMSETGCSHVSFLSINGVDTQAAAMARENALRDALPGASTDVIRDTIKCLNTAGCVDSILNPSGGSHKFGIPTYTADNGDIVVTGSKMVRDSQKWVLVGGRYHINPNYIAPWYDIGLEGAIVIPPLIGAGAALIPLVPGALGPSGPVFGDTAFGAARQGIFNSGRLRIGFGRGQGRANFRIGIDSNKWDVFSRPIPK